jgi:MFS family permease
MGGVTLLLIPAVALLPNGRLLRDVDTKAGPSTAEDWYRSAIGWCLLAGTALWATNAGMLWAFSFDFGSAAGLSLRQVGAIGSACLVASALGSVVSSTICRWIPRRTVLIGAISIQSGAMILVAMLPNPIAYVAGLITFSFSAYACYPLLLGTAAGADPKGGLAVVIASTFYLGAFAGPTIGGALLAWWGTRNVVALVVAISFVPIASMLLLADRRIRAQAKCAPG